MLKVSVSHKQFLFFGKNIVQEGIAPSLVTAIIIFQQFSSTSGLLLPGVELRIWLEQGEEKSLLAKILKILEEARKRLSRQKLTKKMCKFNKKVRKFAKKVHKCEENMKKNVRKKDPISTNSTGVLPL